MSDTSSVNNGLNVDVLAMGATPSPSTGKNGRGSGSGSWFEAVAQAWGETLNSQAEKITTMSDGIGDGNEKPSQLAELSAESMRMNFMANSENTSVSSIGQSLETMARKS